ncbi:putative glucan endo-1,3-beta-glucosidase [Podosphaera aphanis]|nr:putative glucan endo-1,3-beta-glucosidase [Podosphaera aphanis]
MHSSTLLGVGVFFQVASAAFQGFNYGATKSDGITYRVQTDFESLFNTAKNLPGTSGFTSARLYTTVQGGTVSDPTSAIPAAIAENTSLLLGLWVSAGQDQMINEIKALKTAITQYGTPFTKLVAGISVGSEDLYRNSPIGIAAKSGYGAEPSIIANYINQVRLAISDTGLSSCPIGHVDTWTAWVNSSNQAVIDASDWIGMDAYPYFQNTQANIIENGAGLFEQAVLNTQKAVGSKPVWITETGWPVSGSKSGQAETSTSNAKVYWDQVGCPNFGVVNTWWFTLDDTENNSSPDPSFGVVSGSTPLFDLSCSKSNSEFTPSITNISASNINIPVVSSGAALSPSIEEKIGNNTGPGAIPNGLSGTNSSTIKPSGSSQLIPSVIPFPTQNAASMPFGSIAESIMALLVTFILCMH